MNRKAEIERAARAILDALVLKHWENEDEGTVTAEVSNMEEAATAAITPLLDRIERVEAVLARRSEPTMDPPWAKAYNAALDAVSAALQTDTPD